MNQLLILLAAVAAPAAAAEYFVAPGGSDTNAGLTRAAAFATVQRGVDALAPGDTLTLLPGEYFGSVRCEKLGSLEADTVIRAAKPGTVVLRGDRPAPELRKAEGFGFVHVADWPADDEVQTVNERDTLRVLAGKPNAAELEFAPGSFYQDTQAGRLYLSTPDWDPPSNHLYTVSVRPAHGLLLNESVRVTVEGLDVTGFNAAVTGNPSDAGGGTFGILLSRCKRCVVRDCRAWLNGYGIGIDTRVSKVEQNADSQATGDNTIERCVAWANASPSGIGNMGGLTLLEPRRDTIRDSVSFGNQSHGVNLYGGRLAGREAVNRSYLLNNRAWDNGEGDLKIKTGYDSVHVAASNLVGEAARDAAHGPQTESNIQYPTIPTSNVQLSERREWPAMRNPFPSGSHLDIGHSLLGVGRSSLPRLVLPPALHSVTPTTANIEWMTSLPAVCKLGWGATPECTNRLAFDVICFGSYSLTGLDPGTTYYFRLLSIKLPEDTGRHVEPVIAVNTEPLAFTTAAAPAPPCTYYVAPDGDDGHAGTNRAAAWRTLQHAAGRVGTGDTVLIAGGAYRECVRIRATGETNAPIVFRALPGEKAVLDGAQQSLKQGFVVSAKRHLRFDGLTFTGYDKVRPPREFYWNPERPGEFNLYRCRDIQLTRCFSDGRGGASPPFVLGSRVDRLLIRNCVITYKMSGLDLYDCPDAVIEHCVFACPQISAFNLQNRDYILGKEKMALKSLVRHCIFTDNLYKKAELNIGVYGHSDDAVTWQTNCFLLRDVRTSVGHLSLPQFRKLHEATGAVFADPGFAGVASMIAAVDKALREGNPVEDRYTRLFDKLKEHGPGRPDWWFPPDFLMNPNLGIAHDFPSFFATNPDVICRGIGLQPEAFTDR